MEQLCSPPRGFGGAPGGAVGLVRGLLHHQHHTWSSWELAPPWNLGTGEGAQRDAGGSAPLPQIRILGDGGGGGGLDAEEGWRWGVGGNEGVTHPPWISQRMEGRVGGAGTGRGSHEEEG